ncbi:helix-turn-helix domain-containing protein [Actinoplanes sp. CA-030573]|uniref:helix-turn-helix domain-containing protein n=1 Tax=Actinoplanes sp. CA-030573 TaxID=3239898 RepID=UPI003D8B4642
MPRIILSERERELVSLLSQGHTDQEAAEHLGISPRSVTYLLRALMDRLGVDNRFQLGLALGLLREGAARDGAEARPGDLRS